MDDKRLDLDKIGTVMAERGLNAAAVAASLGVSRAIVSEWLKGRKFPRPRTLLELGKLLGLKHSELVVSEGAAEPEYAYRKHGNAKLRPEDEARAKGLGEAVSLLVPYLPLARLNAPARLIAPRVELSYVEEAATETRASMGALADEIRFENIIGLFSELKAILVPVLWGEKDSLDNGLHVYLPDSQVSFVYINLDVKLFDFKYWMLHELAHVKTTSLLGGKEGEAFAEAFAAAVLVPQSLADAQCERLSRIGDTARRIASVLRLAEDLVVSPITLAKRIDESAKASGHEELFGKAIFGATANFNKKYGLVSEQLFGGERPEAKAFIATSEKVFASPVYAALRGYLADHGASEGIVAASLGIGPADAKAMLDALHA